MVQRAERVLGHIVATIRKSAGSFNKIIRVIQIIISDHVLLSTHSVSDILATNEPIENETTMQLDHATIRTRNLSAAKAFFPKRFDLKEKPRPKEIRYSPGHWLFCADRPLVPLVAAAGNGRDGSVEAIDHVGIRLDNYRTPRGKLDHPGIRHSLIDPAAIEERRVFPCAGRIFIPLHLMFPAKSTIPAGAHFPSNNRSIQ